MSTRTLEVFQPYQCTVVQRPVVLVLTKIQDARVPNPQHDPERFEWVTIRQGFKDCQYRHNCPVVEPPGHVGRIKWELCPGREAYENKDSD